MPFCLYMVKWHTNPLTLVFLSMTSRSNTARNDMPETGQPAPYFSLPDQNGAIHTLACFRGKWLVLYFYPKDDTPGCTKQACTFRDDIHELTALGAEVIGVSTDNTSSHADFSKKYQLPFLLLADTKGETARRYNSLVNIVIAKFAKRNTFLIDPTGKIARIYLSASPGRNAREVIEDIKKLSSHRHAENA